MVKKKCLCTFNEKMQATVIEPHKKKKNPLNPMYLMPLNFGNFWASSRALRGAHGFSLYLYYWDLIY